MQEHRRIIDLDEWYTTDQAMNRLTMNVGRPLPEGCAKRMAQRGRVRALALSKNAKLYLKADIDSYQVSKRGRPKGRAR